MKRILVAPLNWGLGHATRCIPIINALLTEGMVPILASDGSALHLLRKEFPSLTYYNLPSYNITYAKSQNRFKLKMALKTPHLLKTINAEQSAVEAIHEIEQLDGIISDNRFGVRLKTVPSVYITHQLKVFSGNTTWITTKMHQRIIKKFDHCWIPDYEGTINLSGDLGHDESLNINKSYIGPLSRFNIIDLELNYDLLVLLSGPEPQRSILEDKLLQELKEYNGTTLLVRGLIEEQQKRYVTEGIDICNYMTTSELEQVIQMSKLILCRPGYTTIMDLAKLGKKAFFIPTPGQYEQEYLAQRFTDEKRVPSCSQYVFNIKKLDEIDNYSGFKKQSHTTDLRRFLSFF